MFENLDQAYSSTDISKQEFKPVPTGKYQARIINFEFSHEKKRFEREFQFIGGQYDGKVQKDFTNPFNKDGEPNEISLGKIRKEIALLSPGMEELPFSQVYQSYLQEALGQVCDVYVSTKEYTKTDGSTGLGSSIYVNKFLGRHDVSGGQPPSSPQGQVAQQQGVFAGAGSQSANNLPF